MKHNKLDLRHDNLGSLGENGRGFDHLSKAVHPSSYRKRLFVMLTAYIDESGTHDKRGIIPGSDIAGICGYIGNEDQWKRFEPIWKKCLGTVKIFHMVDLWWRREEFKGWTIQQRDKLIHKCAHVPGQLELQGLGSFVVVHDFEQMNRRYKSAVQHPYYVALHACISEVLQMPKENFNGEKIDFVFEEQNEFSDYAVKIYKRLKALHDDGRLGGISFESKARIPQLQVADLVAWQVRAEMSRTTYKPHLTIRDAMATLRDQENLYVTYQDKKSMEANWKGLLEANMQGAISRIVKETRGA